MIAGRGGRGLPRWTFAAAGYALLLVAWVFASPPGAAPDEPAHTVRAAAAGAGQWVGRPVAPYVRTAGMSPAQAAYLNALAQEFTIPARLAPVEPCFANRPDDPATCAAAAAASPSSGTVTEVTYTTGAPPVTYAIAGAAMRAPQDVLPPGYLGRLALALASGVLLAMAAWAATGRASLWPMVGLALAVTPAVVFVGSALAPTGVAICAAVCLVAAVTAYWLGPPRRGLLPVVALSGLALAASTSSAAVVLAALAVVLLPLVRLWRLARPGPLLALATVVAAAAAVTAWGLDHRPLPAGRMDVLEALPLVRGAAPEVLQRAIGVFGVGDVRLPGVAYVAWGALAVVVIATALVLGRWRDRLAMALAAVAAVLLAAVAAAFVLAPVGWDLDGRYVLPALGALAIVAGFVLNAAGLPPRADAFFVGGAAGGLQFLAFWENARRYAVGRHGPLDFIDAARWAPPGGWPLWLGVAAAGTVLLVLTMVPLTRAEREQEEAAPLIAVDRELSVSR